jgi:hypothetical protein
MKFNLVNAVNLKRKKIFLLIFITLNAVFFSVIIFNSYCFKYRSINFIQLPLLKKKHTEYKVKFAENDGIIFENQDKTVYNNLIQNNGQKDDQAKEKIRKQISHKDIMDKLRKVKNNNKDKDDPKKEKCNSQKNDDVFSLMKQ